MLTKYFLISANFYQCTALLPNRCPKHIIFVILELSGLECELASWKLRRHAEIDISKGARAYFLLNTDGVILDLNSIALQTFLHFNKIKSQ